MNRDLLFFLLGLLLTVPFSIISNIAMRRYDDVMAKRSVVVREKKLKTLIREYSFIKSLKKDQFYAMTMISRWIIRLIGTVIALGFVFWGLMLIIPYLDSLFSLGSKVINFVAILVVGLGIFIYSVVLRRVERFLRYLNNLASFRLYERKVFEQVTKLGGKVEELKEDNSAPF